jgi:hypothetical protein
MLLMWMSKELKRTSGGHGIISGIGGIAGSFYLLPHPASVVQVVSYYCL